MGARHFFLVTGGDNAIWIALRRHGIRQILARSEAAAVYMADAYARITGRPTFVYGQYGPGAGNVAGALPEPLWSSSPVVAMPTSMRRQHRHAGEYQELEQIHLYSGVTKWQAEAQLPERIPHLVRAGAVRAVGVPPGPVYIGLPSDALELEVPGYVAPEPDSAVIALPTHRPRAGSELVARALDVLRGAERPVIIAGNGVHQSRAYEPLQRVAEALRSPVATSLSGKGTIAETHPLAIGTVGRYSRNYANALVHDADVILAVGSRLGGLVTDSYRLLGDGARIVHVDMDPNAFGGNYAAEVAVNADAGAFLEDLADALGAAGTGDGSRTGWLARVDEARAAWRERRATMAANDGTGDRPMRPEAVLAAVNELAPNDALFLADTGYAAAWAGALLELRRSGLGFLRADGSLGWAFPASLGAKLAAPDRPVIAVTGDGGMGMTLAEVETAVREEAHVVAIVFDNERYGMIRAHQDRHGSLAAPGTDLGPLDFAAAARACGARGVRVESDAAFEGVLRTALAASGPTVIQLALDRRWVSVDEPAFGDMAPT
jgi:acetolactate synthase-1/2/3 large subunit